MMFEEVGDSEAVTANKVRLRRQQKLYRDFNQAGNLRPARGNTTVYKSKRS